MKIYCCTCEKIIDARLTDGAEIYPHRWDLCHLPFWKCDVCSNYVGCHYKNENSIIPLGVIANKDIRKMRKRIHSLIDPIWREGKMRRGDLYKYISDKIGYEFHTGDIQSIEDADKIIKIIREI